MKCDRKAPCLQNASASAQRGKLFRGKMDSIDRCIICVEQSAPCRTTLHAACSRQSRAVHLLPANGRLKPGVQCCRWMEARSLPHNMRAEITAYYSDIWTRHTGMHCCYVSA